MEQQEHKELRGQMGYRARKELRVHQDHKDLADQLGTMGHWVSQAHLDFRV